MKSDVELVLEVKSGERKAFSELVLRHQRSLLRLTLRFTREQSLAEDVVQESFLKAYQKIHLFEGRSSFKSWLFQIALNTAKNRFRERSHDSLGLEENQMSVDSSAESGMVHDDIRKRIRSEVDRLPDKQRMALTLRVFEDMSFKEIAQIMECPYDTAKANYRHALLKLREKLEVDNALEGWSEFSSALETMWDALPVNGTARMMPEAEQ